MTAIFSSKGNKVIKNKDGMYTLESSSSLFLSYATGSIKNITRSNLSSIEFKGDSVMSLAQLLSHHKHGLAYEAVEEMTRQLIEQIKFFERNDFGLLFLAPDDILVINNEVYIIVNTDMFKRREKEMLTIDRPYRKTDFSPPDFLSVKTLPHKVYYKSGYYSVAAVGIWSLLKSHSIKSESDIDETLLPIVQTPLYWFFKRALQKDIAERYIILI